MTASYRMRLFNKIAATVLAAAFFVSDVSFAAPGPAPAPLPIAGDPSLFEAPLDFVQLKEIHKGTNGVFVIHIQDAHANLSGQENLAGALDAIAKKYFTGAYSNTPLLVLSEGGAGDCSLGPVKAMAPREVWKRTAKKYLMEGKLSGEEYLNLVSNHPMKIMGIEDMELYWGSVENYAALTEKRGAILEYLDSIQAALEKLKRKLYPKELLEYERVSVIARSPQGDEAISSSPGTNKIASLAALARNDQLDLSGFPAIQRLFALQDQEKTIDFDLANLEQAALMEEIQKRGGGVGAQLIAPLRAMTRAKDSKVSQFTLLQNAFNRAKQKNIALSVFPNLLSYAEYLEGFSHLDLDDVLNEMERLEDKVYKVTLSLVDALLVRSIDRYIHLLQTAYRIQMSTKEFKFFQVNEPDFATDVYLAFMNRKLAELGYPDSLIPYKNLLEEGKKSLMAFYDSVDQRDLAFMRNMEKIMAEEWPRHSAAVLITGGYHTQHLKELMKAKGYSYAVLTPIVTSETNQKKYERLLLSPLKPLMKKLDLIEGHRTRKTDSVRPIRIALNDPNFKALLMDTALSLVAIHTEAEAQALVDKTLAQYRQAQSRSLQSAGLALRSSPKASEVGARMAVGDTEPGSDKTFSPEDKKEPVKLRDYSKEIARLRKKLAAMSDFTKPENDPWLLEWAELDKWRVKIDVASSHAIYILGQSDASETVKSEAKSLEYSFLVLETKTHLAPWTLQESGLIWAIIQYARTREIGAASQTLMIVTATKNPSLLREYLSAIKNLGSYATETFLKLIYSAPRVAGLSVSEVGAYRSAYERLKTPEKMAVIIRWASRVEVGDRLQVEGEKRPWIIREIGKGIVTYEVEKPSWQFWKRRQVRQIERRALQEAIRQDFEGWLTTDSPRRYKFLEGSPGARLAAHGPTQCVTGDTLLPLARMVDDGSWTVDKLMPIRDVKAGDYVLSLSEETQTIEPHRIKGLLDMGIKPVYKLTTKSGRSIKTTANHPYLVKRENGEWKVGKAIIHNPQSTIHDPSSSTQWTKVSDLRVGDEVGVPGTYPSNFRSSEINGTSSVRFSNIVNNLSAYKSCDGFWVIKFFMEFLIWSKCLGKIFTRMIPGCLGGGVFSAKSESWVTSTQLSLIAMDRTSPFTRPFGESATSCPNPDKNGIRPWWVFSSSKNLMGSNQKGGIQFSFFQYAGRVVQSGLDVIRGQVWIGLAYFFVRTAALEHIQHQIDHDTSALEAGFPMADLGVDGNILLDEVHGPVSLIQQVYHAQVWLSNWVLPAAAAAEWVKTNHALRVIQWDPIVSIEPLGSMQVWDIEVEGTHNFIGNGIFAHNTYLGGVIPTLGLALRNSPKASEVGARMAGEGALRLADLYGKLNGTRLASVDRLGEGDRVVLGTVAAARGFQPANVYPVLFVEGVALVSMPAPGQVALSSRDGARLINIGTLPISLPGKRVTEEVVAPEVTAAARRTAQVLASLPEDGDPVLLNIIAGDVLTTDESAVREMVRAAKPFLESRKVFLRFGEVVDSRFRVNEKYGPLNTASKTLAGRQGTFESYIGAEDSLEKLTIPVSAGIAIVQRKDGQIVRLLDTFVKTAIIRRTDDPLRIKQEIVTIADATQVDRADSSKLVYLHDVPDNINDPVQKPDILASLRPFTVIALNFNVEQMLAYVRLVTRAVGAAA